MARGGMGLLHGRDVYIVLMFEAEVLGTRGCLETESQFSTIILAFYLIQDGGQPRFTVFRL